MEYLAINIIDYSNADNVTTKKYVHLKCQNMSESSKSMLKINFMGAFDEICFVIGICTRYFSRNNCISKIPMGSLLEGIKKVHDMNKNSIR